MHLPPLGNTLRFYQSAPRSRVGSIRWMVMVLLIPFFLASSASAQTTLNVRDFGAKGDGTTIDQAAIQGAIDEARRLGGATVYFPDGTYLVQPQVAPLAVCSRLTLLGQSKKAVIKVMDNAGDYFKVFGNGVTVVEEFTLQNLTIDQNPLGNTTCDVQFGVLPQITIYINQFKNILIDNCSFIQSGTNCIVVHDENGPGGVKIRNNQFQFVPGLSSEPDFDNTTVTLTCKDQEVVNNVFTESVGSNRGAPITQRARTAIENDGALAYTSGNSCDGYVVFVAVSSDKASNITIAQNSVIGAERAIMLEPYSKNVMRNIAITDNTFQLNQKDRQSELAGGVLTYQKKAAPGGFFGLTITGNTIVYQWDSIGYSIPSADISAAISLCAQTDLDSVTIANNIIANAPVHGIRLGVYDGYSRSHIRITGNQIFNPGLNKLASSTPAGISLGGGTTNGVTVESNRIDTALQYGTYTPAFDGIRVQGSSGVTIIGVNIASNEVSSVSKTAIQISTIDSTLVSGNTLTGLPFAGNVGILVSGVTNDLNSIVVADNPTSGFATPVSWSIASLPLKVQLVSVQPLFPATATVRTFTWRQSSPGVLEYDFSLAADSSFQQLLSAATVTDTVIQKSVDLSTGPRWWKVRAKNSAGWGLPSDAQRIGPSNGIPNEPSAFDFRLEQNYPNPFNPRTTIVFSIPVPEQVSLHFFNSLGQEVATYALGHASAGVHMWEWDASKLASGVYFCRLVAGGRTDVKRMMLLK